VMERFSAASFTQSLTRVDARPPKTSPSLSGDPFLRATGDAMGRRAQRDGKATK
jgi:hypothetical protein